MYYDVMNRKDPSVGTVMTLITPIWGSTLNRIMLFIYCHTVSCYAFKNIKLCCNYNWHNFNCAMSHKIVTDRNQKANK